MSKKDPLLKTFLDLLSQSLSFRKEIDFSSIPSTLKSYKVKSIPLEKKLSLGSLSLEQAITQRKSRRVFEGKMTIQQLSSLLLCANGFKEFVDTKYGVVYRSTTPSAGSRHPIELYLIIRDVEGVKDGIYHYNVEKHALELLIEKRLLDLSLWKQYGIAQEVAGANVFLLMTAVFERSFWKYGLRAFRLLFLDAGHIGQNIYLGAEALGLSACAHGGIRYDRLQKLLKLDEKSEQMVYVMSLGNRKI